MEGKLVRLRRYEKRDLEEVMSWVNDEEVKVFLGSILTLPVSRVAQEQWIEHAAKGSSTDQTFAIETLVGEYLGGCSLGHIDWIDRNAEAGIVIGKKQYWGKGYGSDAMRVMLRMAFENMNLHRVALRVFSFNQRAVKSYENCGFKQEGVQRETRFVNGKFEDAVMMGILEQEYFAGRD